MDAARALGRYQVAATGGYTMADNVKEQAQETVDKEKGESIDNASDALDDQTKKAQGTIDQGKGDAKQGAAEGKSKVEEASDKITDN